MTEGRTGRARREGRSRTCTREIPASRVRKRRGFLLIILNWCGLGFVLTVNGGLRRVGRMGREERGERGIGKNITSLTISSCLSYMYLYPYHKL